MNSKIKDFQKKFKEVYSTFKTTFKQERSKKSEDIIFREKKRETENKIKALNVAIKDKNAEQVNVLKTKKNSSNESLLDKGKQRKEKRVKAWSDRGYRTIGPTLGATIGGAIGLVGGPIGAAVGTVMGVAVGSVVGGRVIQKIAEGYGIPAHKAFKKAKERFKSLKQEQIHEKEIKHLNKIGAIHNKDEYGRKQVKMGPNEMRQVGKMIRQQPQSLNKTNRKENIFSNKRPKSNSASKVNMSTKKSISNKKSGIKF